MLAARVSKLVALRRSQRAQRKLALVIFNFPPNAGATGTAAYLSVFESLHHTLTGLKAAGYVVDVPADVDVLRRQIIEGNASRHGAAGVHVVTGAQARNVGFYLRNGFAPLAHTAWNGRPLVLLGRPLAPDAG